MHHLRRQWRRAQGSHSVLSGLFLSQPHDSLYGAAWEPSDGDGGWIMRPEAKVAFTETVADLVPHAVGHMNFAVIGSGACYNWDESGDLDVQVWVDDSTILRDVRRAIVGNLVGTYTCADLGLTSPPGDGSMEVQWYAKPGLGTFEENAEGQPYACYDMQLDEWVVAPYPLTPSMYADQFIAVEGHAEEVAAEAEVLLSLYDRARASALYWSGLSATDKMYDGRSADAHVKVLSTQADVKALYDSLKANRAAAYKADGRGIHDERDSVWKLLQVWGIVARLESALA